MSGPRGEELYCDTAWIGPSTPRAVLISISGTHGLEAAAGSQGQAEWLRSSGPAAIDERCAVLLVHAINPWGFAHQFRTTEGNVDLNRNFLAPGAARLPNPIYGELHPILCPVELGEGLVEQATEALKEAETRYGRDPVSEALNRGQYSHADGSMYGGHAPVWSNLTLAAILQTIPASVERVACVDWHTALGEYGKPFYLSFDRQFGASPSPTIEMWELDKDYTAESGFDDAAVPEYQGTVFDAVREWLEPRPVVGGVIEFGTVPYWESYKLCFYEFWLKFVAADDHPDRLRVHQELIKVCAPDDPAWWASVRRESRRIHQQMIDWLMRT